MTISNKLLCTLTIQIFTKHAIQMSDSSLIL